MKLLPLTIFAYGLCAFFQISEAKKSFNCKSDGMRIRKIQRCDGHFDCKDGSDEEETMCLAYECINDDYVKCKDGLQCVNRGFLCDGDVKSDCRDKSDEDEYFCRANKCKTFHISCNDDLTCVSVTSMCDGHNDCKDKTDENPDFCKDFLPLIK
ncbi:very low-density lipoprotein receptor-like [Mytilus edulis]|uniref:very low-density lipoprotein receptor-like n=1 Tax=Mytilus edulis TaxID=6550 RepID=UPI0039F0136C